MLVVGGAVRIAGFQKFQFVLIRRVSRFEPEFAERGRFRAKDARGNQTSQRAQELSSRKLFGFERQGWETDEWLARSGMLGID